MSKDKKIPVKNYLIVVLLAVIVVLLTLYINAWYKTYQENKLSVSPFSGEVEEVDLKEISLTFAEMNEVVLYIGYTNNKSIYDMESRLLKYIKSNDLIDKFIYVDVTDYKKSEYLDILKNTFSDKSEEINEVPLLIFVKNGKAELVINSKAGVINTSDIDNIKEKYDLEDN